MDNISVRSLLLESRIDSSFEKQLANLKEIGNKLQELKESSQVMYSLTETDTLLESKNTAVEMFKDSSKIFKNIKKNLKEARDADDLNIKRNRTKIARDLMEDLKIIVSDIEENLHESLDEMESNIDEDLTEVLSESSFEELYEALNLKYKEIVNIAGNDADRGLEILDKRGRSALFNYLKQFGNTGSGDVSKSTHSSRDDQRFRMGDYIVFYNKDLGYIGVEQVFSRQ
jgi:hypothetical protein